MSIIVVLTHPAKLAAEESSVKHPAMNVRVSATND